MSAATAAGWCGAVIVALGCDHGRATRADFSAEAGAHSGGAAQAEGGNDQGTGGAAQAEGGNDQGTGGARGASLIRNVVLRPRDQGIRSAQLAFSGDTLGVLAVAGRNETRLLFGLESSSGYALSELKNGSHAGTRVASAITGTEDGFTVVWGEPSSEDSSELTVHLTRMSLQGEWLSEIVVGTFSYGTCELAEYGGTALVACGELLARCSQDRCEPLALPACPIEGTTRVVWDTEAFALTRHCLRAAPQGIALELTRVAADGEIVVGPVEVARLDVYSATAGLALDGDRLLAAFGPTLYELALDGGILSTSAVTIPEMPQQASMPGIPGYAIMTYWLTQDVVVTPEERLILSSMSFEAATHGTQMVGGENLLTSTVRGSAETRVVARSSGALVASGNGRVLLVTSSPAAVQEYDPATASLGTAVPVDEMRDPVVLGASAEGSSCRVALCATAADPELDDVIELAVGEQVVDRTLLEGQTCGATPRALFTSSGAVVVNTGTESAWVRQDGSVAWREPPLAALPGPSDPQHPRLFAIGGSEADEYELVEFRESGTDVTAYGAWLYPAYVCEDGLYVREAGPSPPVSAVEPGGELRVLVDWPEMFGPEFCINNQLWGRTEPSTQSHRYQRVRTDGAALLGITLPGPLVIPLSSPILRGAWGVMSSKDGVGYLVVSTEATVARTDFVQDLALVAVVESNTPSITDLRLSEPGEALSVSVSDEYAHIVWRSERNVMLSSWQLGG